MQVTQHLLEQREIVEKLSYQLVYVESSRLAPWCIADKLGNILWCNFTYLKAVWRLKSRIEDGILIPNND